MKKLVAFLVLMTVLLGTASAQVTIGTVFHYKDYDFQITELIDATPEGSAEGANRELHVVFSSISGDIVVTDLSEVNEFVLDLDIELADAQGNVYYSRKLKNSASISGNEFKLTKTTLIFFVPDGCTFDNLTLRVDGEDLTPAQTETNE